MLAFFFLTCDFFLAKVQDSATPKKLAFFQARPFFQLEIRDIFKGRL
jgi:hypothetical protein